jgi:hypothetical protein
MASMPIGYTCDGACVIDRFSGSAGGMVSRDVRIGITRLVALDFRSRLSRICRRSIHRSRLLRHSQPRTKRIHFKRSGSDSVCASVLSYPYRYPRALSTSLYLIVCGSAHFMVWGRGIRTWSRARQLPQRIFISFSMRVKTGQTRRIG